MKNLFVLSLSMFMCTFSFIINKRSNKRLRNLEKCVLMLEQIETKVLFSSDNVYTIINDLCNSSDLSFLNTFICSDENTVLKKRWEDSIMASKFADCFKSEEVRILVSFGKMFGITDKDGQIKNCRAHKQMLNSVYSKASEEISKRGNLITTLGVISSIGIIVLFI